MASPAASCDNRHVRLIIFLDFKDLFRTSDGLHVEVHLARHRLQLAGGHPQELGLPVQDAAATTATTTATTTTTAATTSTTSSTTYSETTATSTSTTTTIGSSTTTSTATTTSTTTTSTTTTALQLGTLFFIIFF